MTHQRWLHEVQVWQGHPAVIGVSSPYIDTVGCLG